VSDPVNVSPVFSDPLVTDQVRVGSARGVSSNTFDLLAAVTWIGSGSMVRYTAGVDTYVML
jgi:hypothetical protein